MSSETVDLRARIKRLEALLECSNGDFCQLEQMYEKVLAENAEQKKRLVAVAVEAKPCVLVYEPVKSTEQENFSMTLFGSSLSSDSFEKWAVACGRVVIE